MEKAASERARRPSTRQRYRSAIGQLAAIGARESPDLGMAEILAACLAEKSDEGYSTSGMRGIFAEVRALKDMCIVPPLLGAIHRRIAGGGGVPSQGRRIMRPQRCSATCGRRQPRKGTAPSLPLPSCPGCFLTVGESVSVRPFHLLKAGGVSFYRTKSGGPGGWHRRPPLNFDMSWVGYLSEYCKRPPHRTAHLQGGGGGFLEEGLTTLLRGSRWSDYAWHRLRRGGAPSCWNQKLGLPYFKWRGGSASTGVAMRYATAFLDHGVLESLGLPCPGAGVEEPPVVNCLSLWGSAMCGADTVEESLGYLGPVLGPALPHPGAVAAGPPATVVGGQPRRLSWP